MSAPIPAQLCEKCIYWHWETFLPPDAPEFPTDAGVLICDAFPEPEGIPAEITLEEVQHTKPYPGDHGKQFVEGPPPPPATYSKPWWPQTEPAMIPMNAEKFAKLPQEMRDAIFNDEPYMYEPVAPIDFDRMQELLRMIVLRQPKPDDLTENELLSWETLVLEVEETREAGEIVDFPFD